MHIYCSVCESRDQKPFIKEDNIQVVTCRNCGHLYTGEVPETRATSYYISSNWIKQPDPALPSSADHRYITYARELTHLITEPGKILDIGCANGRFLFLMAERGWLVHGVEPSQDGDIAARTFGNEVIHRHLYQELLPWKFDVITAFEVIEHIPEPQLVVERIFQQLRPGGYLMGSVPNGDFIRIKVLPRKVFGLEKILVPLTMDPGNHINYFNAAGLRKLFERTGFQVHWVRNAPVDFNYLANRTSSYLKKIWHKQAEIVRLFSERLIGSNLWFLTQKPE
jgi:2-polyprenyl-3-methyl-5-hydroxy-6-metoxy-1,4-benzoquinol methylase